MLYWFVVNHHCTGMPDEVLGPYTDTSHDQHLQRQHIKAAVFKRGNDQISSAVVRWASTTPFQWYHDTSRRAYKDFTSTTVGGGITSPETEISSESAVKITIRSNPERNEWPLMHKISNMGEDAPLTVYTVRQIQVEHLDQIIMPGPDDQTELEDSLHAFVMPDGIASPVAPAQFKTFDTFDKAQERARTLLQQRHVNGYYTAHIKEGNIKGEWVGVVIQNRKVRYMVTVTAIEVKKLSRDKVACPA